MAYKVFFTCKVFIWFRYQAKTGLIKWVKWCFLLSRFWKILKRILCFFFSFVCACMEFIDEAIWSWDFLCWNVLVRGTFSICHSQICYKFRFTISSWVSFGGLCSSRNLCISSSSFYSCRVTRVFFCNLFCLWKICENVLFLYLLFGNLNPQCFLHT